VRRCRPLLGTFVEIETEDEAAIEAGFAAVATVQELMSAHEPASELSLVNRKAHLELVPVSEWTAAVLMRAIHWSRVSEGRFDVVRAGASALSLAAIPLHPGQPSPDPAADWTDLAVERRMASLDRPACLDLGGIAKGFAVDRAVEAMQAAGAVRGLVNAGGDIRSFGPEPWPVDIVEPGSRRSVATVELQNASLATSAGLLLEGALSFDHVLAARQWISVTVCTSICCDADALTKIIWTKPADSRLLLREAGAKAFGIRPNGMVEEVGAEEFAA
jgi:thiamine biosynthesis lipoprotein